VPLGCEAILGTAVTPAFGALLEGMLVTWCHLFCLRLRGRPVLKDEPVRVWAIFAEEAFDLPPLRRARYIRSTGEPRGIEKLLQSLLEHFVGLVIVGLILECGEKTNHDGVLLGREDD